MGDAWETTDKPAIVLIDMSAHSAHHCHVLNAWPKVYSRSDRCDNCTALGVQPAGFQPSGGFLMSAPAETAMTPYAAPRYENVESNPTCCISHPAAGAANNAPTPNPATAIPVIRPRRSGNHFTRTVIGTM